MHETTRALIRCEIADRRERLEEAYMAGTLTPEKDRRLREEITDLCQTIQADVPVYDHAVGDIDLTHGEAVHIHNG